MHKSTLLTNSKKKKNQICLSFVIISCLLITKFGIGTFQKWLLDLMIQFFMDKNLEFQLFSRFSILLIIYSNFSCMLLNPTKISSLHLNCSNLLDMRNIQKQVKKHSVTKHSFDLSLFE
jgi:hypothetical protein